MENGKQEMGIDGNAPHGKEAGVVDGLVKPEPTGVAV